MGILQLNLPTFPIHFIPPSAESPSGPMDCVRRRKFEEVKLEGVPTPYFPWMPVPSRRLV